MKSKTFFQSLCINQLASLFEPNKYVSQFQTFRLLSFFSGQLSPCCIFVFVHFILMICFLEYNQSFKLEANRKSRAFLRLLKSSKCFKFDVYYKRLVEVLSSRLCHHRTSNRTDCVIVSDIHLGHIYPIFTTKAWFSSGLSMHILMRLSSGRFRNF